MNEDIIKLAQKIAIMQVKSELIAAGVWTQPEVQEAISRAEANL